MGASLIMSEQGFEKGSGAHHAEISLKARLPRAAEGLLQAKAPRMGFRFDFGNGLLGLQNKKDQTWSLGQEEPRKRGFQAADRSGEPSPFKDHIQ